jgi:hypothetical protein
LIQSPQCGLYRTTQALEGIAAGRLVYFHNHGEPGPGVYLPERWSNNRVVWQSRGTTAPSAEWIASLQPLAAEGLYRVREEFFCCAKECRRYEPGTLVQLGYDGDANALLFVPEWTQAGLQFPLEGLRFEAANLRRLEPLKVAEAHPQPGSHSPLIH